MTIEYVCLAPIDVRSVEEALGAIGTFGTVARVDHFVAQRVRADGVQETISIELSLFNVDANSAIAYSAAVQSERGRQAFGPRCADIQAALAAVPWTHLD